MKHTQAGSVRRAVLFGCLFVTAAVSGGLLLFDGVGPNRLEATFEQAAGLARSESEPEAERAPDGNPATLRQEEQGRPQEPETPVEPEAALPPDATGLTGRIIGRDGKPVAGAEVVVQRSVDEEETPMFGVTLEQGKPKALFTKSAVSDEQGRFAVIDLIPRDQYRVRVATDAGEVGRKPGIELIDRVVLDVGDIPLTRGVEVSGRVLTDGGGTVEGARVEFKSSWSQEPIVTDGKGRFQSGTLFPGTHTLDVVASGYALPETYRRQFVEGERVDDLELILVQAAPIRGVVVDQAGRGLAGAWVSAYRTDNTPFGGYGADTTTDEDGRFAFDSITRGSYRIWAQRAGYQTEEQTETEAPGPELQIRLTRMGVIEGAVVDAATGQPVKAERLGLLWIPPWTRKNQGAGAAEYGEFHGDSDVEIREDGTFTIGFSRGGSFKVEAFAPGYAPARSEALELEENQIQSGVLVSMAPGIALPVRVLDGATREPIPGVVLEIHSQRGGGGDLGSSLVNLGYLGGGRNRGGSLVGERVGRIATGLDGTAVLGSVTPGTFVILATKNGYAETHQKDVAILPGISPEAIEMLMGLGGSIEGVVTNTLGEVEPALKVIASRSEGAGREAVTGENGRYRIENLAPGRYMVEVDLGDERRPQRGVGFDLPKGKRSRDVSREERFPVQVQGGETATHDLVIERVVPGSLAGTVMINGSPAADVQLIASRIDPENRQRFSFDFNQRVISDALGRFRFRRLDPAEYSLLVFRSWSASFKGGEALVLAGRETTITVDVGLGSLSGAVFDPDGRPIEGATVRANQHQEGGRSFSFGGSPRETSDAGGRFQIGEMEAGIYSLTISRTGFLATNLPEVRVTGQRNTGPLEIRMSPGGWIRARVTGVPASDFGPARLQLEFSDAQNQTSKSRWEQPDGEGYYWLEVGANLVGTLTVKSRNASNTAELVGTAAIELQEGRNAEVTVRLE
ncbi:MAG: carboxypeptidase-like regulatory domain-containing protein [Planctomycetota bacterium]